LKPKAAFYWCGSCGGCEAAFLDLAEGLLDLVERVEFVFWPLILDSTKEELEALPDGGLKITLISGMVNGPEQEEMAKLLREKSKSIVAFGACAQLGGLPGLWNLYGWEGIKARLYKDKDKDKDREGEDSALPELWEAVKPLDQVIEVDYYLPGCPPLPQWITIMLNGLLSDEPPPKGTNFVPEKVLCSVCPRRETRPKRLSLPEIRRFHQVELDPEACLLAQGFVCFGPATRAGCGALCIRGNMPCTGCFGPPGPGRTKDYGTRALAAIASLVSPSGDLEERGGPALPDPAGVFYFYSLAALPAHLSLSPSRKPRAEEKSSVS